MINNLPSTGDMSGPLLLVLHAITHLTFTMVISHRYYFYWTLDLRKGKLLPKVVQLGSRAKIKPKE